MEITSSQFSLSDCIKRITDILKKLECKIVVEARNFELKNCLGGSRGQVFICPSKSGMMAAIHIQAR